MVMSSMIPPRPMPGMLTTPNGGMLTPHPMGMQPMGGPAMGALMPPGPPPGMMGPGGPPQMGHPMGVPVGPPPMGGMPPEMQGMMPGGQLPPGMMGAMPPPPSGPPPDDPLAAMGPNPLMMMLQDPKFLQKMMDAFKPKQLPLYRAKWQEPAMLTEGEMLDAARRDQTMLTTINRRFQNDLARIRMEAAGVFDDFDEDAEIPFKSSALADEDQLIGSLVGTIPPAFESPKIKPFDDDEAQAKEDFLYYLHEQHRRQHSKSGWGDLDIEMAKTITRYGRVITCNLCDFNARKGASPFKMRLIDPSICYPTFMGQRGLVRVTLIYHSTVSDFLGNHDDDGDIEKKILGGSMKKKDTDSSYRLEDVIEIIEYWDCKNVGIFAAGKLVKGPVAHNYGEPPFVYTTAPYGDPSYTRTPLTYDENTGYDSGYISGQEDFARRGLSHFHTRFETHAQREAIFSRLMTALAMWKQEPINLQRDAQAAGLDKPKISRASGAVNVIPEGFHILPSLDSPVPPTLGPLMNASNEDVSRSGLSPAEYGLTPSAQQSGYAIAGLSENGRNKLAPVIKTKQDHHAMVAEQRLRFYRDWGHLLGDHGSKGSLTIPKVMPGIGKEGTSWEVTPNQIDRTGSQATCNLVDTPDVGTLSALGAALGSLGEQGVVTRRDKIKLIGLPGSRNPDQTMREVDIEKMKEMPEYMLGSLLKYIYEEEGDPGLANFVAAQIAKGKAKEAAASMAPPGGGPPSANGLSGPMMGHPPGQEGGRPPMGGPPPGAMVGGPPPGGGLGGGIPMGG